jgi:hypothetical protein
MYDYLKDLTMIYHYIDSILLYNINNLLVVFIVPDVCWVTNSDGTPIDDKLWSVGS